MPISVASRRIDRLHALSHRTRLVLGLIDGGLHWTEWAIADRRARYHFENDGALVAAVQSGLHASRLIFLRRLGLVASPDALMALPADELKALAQAEHPDWGVAGRTRVDKICRDYGFLSAKDLVLATEFVEELGVVGEPLFQAMDLGDRLTLISLAAGIAEGEPFAPELQLEAAKFAVGQARTIPEFADYFAAYLHFAVKCRLASRPARERTAGAGEAVELLQPLLYHALDCPRVELATAREEVPAAIEDWLMMGRRVGFSRLSQGVQQIIAHSDFCEAPRDDAHRIVAAYLGGAQALLMSAGVEPVGVQQVGTTLFRARSAHEEAIVTLGTEGLITLTAFKRLPPEPPIQTETDDGRR